MQCSFWSQKYKKRKESTMQGQTNDLQDSVHSK